MSTPPVMSINDELLAELEAAANAATPGPWTSEIEGGHLNVASEDWYLLQLHADQPRYIEDSKFVAAANPATIIALLAHIADLKQQVIAAGITAENCEHFRRNAERYQWLRNPERVPRDDPFGHLIVGQAEGEDILWRDELDRFIDYAMQEAAP